jgi:hypothetical protein
VGNKTDFTACVKKGSIYPRCLNIFSDPVEVRAFYANKALFTSKLVSRRSKLKLYWPVVVYGCETWVLKENIIQKLSVFERKILRKVCRKKKKKD